MSFNAGSGWLGDLVLGVRRSRVRAAERDFGSHGAPQHFFRTFELLYTETYIAAGQLSDLVLVLG